MSDALDEWAEDYTVKTLTRTTVDFQPVDTVSLRTVRAVVQPADPQRLQTLAGLDWSLRYLSVYSLGALSPGEFLDYRGSDYKIIPITDWTDYGYCHAIAEQTRRAPLL